MVQMRIDQIGLPAGTVGKARTDGLSNGALVTVLNTTGGSTTTVRLLWVPPGDLTARPSLLQSGPATWTFAPQAGTVGSYRILMTVDEGLPTESQQIRIFGVRSAVTGLLIPAANEVANPAASLGNDGSALIDASENNEPFGPFVAGSPWGWWRSISDLFTYVEGGGGGSLQSAYDVGNAIITDAKGQIDITDGVFNADAQALRVTQNRAGSRTGIHVLRAPIGSGPHFGEAFRASMGSQAGGAGVLVEHAGSGPGVRADAQGPGFAGAFEATTQLGQALFVGHSDPANSNPAATISHSGFGVALQILVNGSNAIEASTTGDNLFTLGPGLADFGSSSTPVTVRGYSSVLLGVASDATFKGLSAYSSVVGAGDPALINNLGRILFRPGSGTASATTADLAIRPGSEAEVLLTKGGEVFAQRTLVEIPIQSGETISAGQGVAASATSGRCRRSSGWASAGLARNIIGVCIKGGTGDAGGTVRALVAVGGVVSNLSGLTANAEVYLSTSAVGTLTSAVPTGQGNISMRVGFAYSASDMAIHVGEAVVL